jgi:HlyD family secretion protein
MARTTERRRKLIWGTIGAVGLAALVVALLPDPLPADFQEVERGTLQVTLDHEGRTRVRDRYTVTAPFTGRILRITLEPGDSVEAGRTVLATFRPDLPVMLDPRTRASAEARRQSAQASLEGARAERERARAEREFALAALERAKRLHTDGILAREQLDAAETDARARSEAYQAAEAAVRAAQHDLEAAQAALLEGGDTTGVPMRTLELRSPVTGVVLRRMHESETPVPAGEPLLEVADPADLEVIADYLSTDAVRIRPGMPVLFERWGGEEALRGRVRRVEPAGFIKISALGVEEQRVWVVMDFEDPYDAWKALGDGYRVETRVVVWERDDVLKAPVSALLRNGGGWAVFVEERGRARLRPVEVGQRSALRAEILEGLQEGERVIVHPSDSIRDKARVKARG